MGREIIDYSLKVLNECMMLESLNVTKIILILKIPHLTNLRDFRPISSCTVLYKLIAKTIENRFQRVLKVCIDSARVPLCQVI